MCVSSEQLHHLVECMSVAVCVSFELQSNWWIVGLFTLINPCPPASHSSFLAFVRLQSLCSSAPLQKDKLNLGRRHLLGEKFQFLHPDNRVIFFRVKLQEISLIFTYSESTSCQCLTFSLLRVFIFKGVFFIFHPLHWCWFLSRFE